MARGNDLLADETSLGYDCTRPRVSVSAAFTDGKQIGEETAMRLICDTLAVTKPLRTGRRPSFGTRIRTIRPESPGIGFGNQRTDV